MFCPNCGRENSSEAKFCAGCGSPLPMIQNDGGLQDGPWEDVEFSPSSGTDPDQKKPSKKGSGKKKLLLFIIAAVIAVITVVTILLIGKGAGSEKTQEEEYLEAAENYGEVNAALTEVAESLEDDDMTTDEKAQLYLDTLEELEEEGLIQESSVVYDESLSEISYNYADGAVGGILLEEIEEGTSGYGTDSYITSYNSEGYAATTTDDPVSFDIEGSPYEEGELSGFAVWGLGEGYEDELEVMEGSVINWNKAYLTTRIDYDFTLEEMRTALSGYDFVAIQLHGYAGCGYPVLEDGQTFTEYFLGNDEADLTEEEIATIEDLQAGRVMMKMIGLSGNTFNYVVCPEFFTYYYGDNGLEDTIVWLGCCDGYLYDELVNSIYDCGADAVLACTESVITYYNLFCQDAFVYSLLYGNTVDESLSLAQSAWGENDNIFAQVFLSKTDDTPSEIRYCEGSADATLVTLTQEALASLEADGTSEPEIYAEVLDLFYYGISTQWENYEYKDVHWYGIESESSGSGSSSTISYIWYQYAEDENLSLSDAGYALIDLDSDGVCELLIDVCNEDGSHGSGIRDVYTYRNGEIVHLASLSERSNLYLCSNYTIGYGGTTGSGEGGAWIDDYYGLYADAEYLEIIDSLTYVYDEETYYYSDTSEYTYNENDKISDDEAQAIIDSYVRLEYDLTPFSEYTPSEGTAQTDEETDPDEAYGRLADFVASEEYQSVITPADYGYDSFEDLTDDGYEPYYVIADLNADDESELLICAGEGTGFYFTWTFVYDQGEVCLIDEFYGYGQYRYSSVYNAVVVPCETKPDAYTNAVSFYRIEGTAFNRLFSVAYDTDSWYYSDSSGTEAMDTTFSESEYSEGIEDLEWISAD